MRNETISVESKDAALLIFKDLLRADGQGDLADSLTVDHVRCARNANGARALSSPAPSAHASSPFCHLPHSPPSQR